MEKKGVSVKALLDYIPSEVLESLSVETGVDRQVKKLSGRTVFQVLLYSLLSSSRLSLNVVLKCYESAVFQDLVHMAKPYRLKRSTLSDRLSTMQVRFFEALYEQSLCLFEKYCGQEAQKYKICRVDSTTVSCSGKLLKFGMYNGMKPADESERIKQLKFSVCFDGLLVKKVKMYEEQRYLAEDKALTETILSLKQGKDEIVVFDRGLKKRKSFRAFDEQNRLFVTRINPDSFYETVMPCSKAQDTNTLHFQSDQAVYLRSNGNTMKYAFRLIQSQSLKNGETLWFLTNIWTLSAAEIAQIYQKRWEIEVFFRFLKQELSFSHLLNRSANGIAIMLYMTLIAAMLILVFRKLNNLEGYKIVKLEFINQLEKQVIADIVILCGGNQELFYKLFPS